MEFIEEANEIFPGRRTASQAGARSRKSATFSETLAKQRQLFKQKEINGSGGLNKSFVSNARLM